MNKLRYTLLFIISIATVAFSQRNSENPKPTAEYDKVQQSLQQGWNTWNTESVLSHVLLPEGFQIRLTLKDKGLAYEQSLQQVFLSSKKEVSYSTQPIAHAYDGSYTALKLDWHKKSYLIETASDGKNWLAIISPNAYDNAVSLVVDIGFLWKKQGSVRQTEDALVGETSSSVIRVKSLNDQTSDFVNYTNAPYMTFDLDTKIYLYTGEQTISQKDIEAFIEAKKLAHQESITSKYQNSNPTYAAIQNIMAWNTIYEPYTKAVVTPVSRNWNDFFGGHVLFCWDTYFGAMLASVDNKALAYANAVEITHTARQTPGHFVPNYKNPYNGSMDRSQPPVGSFVVDFLYKKYQDKWFLEETYNDLLNWNQWWWNARRTEDNYLCWGSSKTNVANPDAAENTLLGAKYESGLDNSPMYEAVPFNPETGLMELADVGLMSLYILDCNSLMSIALHLGKKNDYKAIKKRKQLVAKQLARMWNSDTQLYQNVRTDTKKFDPNISPTCFYPLLTDVPSPKQAQAMVDQHYFNEDEFYGDWVMPSTPKNSPYYIQNYWRGRIWAPMNFLVYMGLQKYGLQKAQKDLSAKSNLLLIDNYQDNKAIYENFNAIEGKGRLASEPITHSDAFYHWGGLLGLIRLLEDENITLISNE